MLLHLLSICRLRKITMSAHSHRGRGNGDYNQASNSPVIRMGLSGGVMVVGKPTVPGRPTNLDNSRASTERNN